MKGFIKDEIPSRWDENKMTHDELLAKIMRTEFYKEKQPNNVSISVGAYNNENANAKALRAVVELHKPVSDNSCSEPGCCGGPYPDLCENCSEQYPCETIEAIEKELG